MDYKKQHTMRFNSGLELHPKFTPNGDSFFEGIDLYCGAGGVTAGLEDAVVDGKKIARVVGAINHDRIAIESHWQNHPHVTHFVEKIEDFNVKRLPKTNPTARKFLWASLECTNHSNAKGGLSRDADSRTQADDLDPYVLELSPDYVMIENVREFRDWGPLVQKKSERGKPLFDKKGKPLMLPDREKRGIYYRRWKRRMTRFGYNNEERILNAADYGAHTSRKRLFIIFAKVGLPIAWPEPTHAKNGLDSEAFSEWTKTVYDPTNPFSRPKPLYKWRPVSECLDFNDKGQNIFGRKKDLSDNTYKRIYAGLVKFIANGDESFMAQYNGAGFDDRIFGSDETCRTVTTANRFAVVQPEFLIKYHGNGKNVLSIDEPASTIPTKDRLAKVHVEHFVAKYNSSHNNTKQNAGNRVDEPSATITARPGLGLITVERFMDHQYSSGQKNKSINEPSGSILTVPKQRLVSVFIMNTNYNNVGAGLNDPIFSLVSSRRHPYLIQIETGEIAIAIEKSDTEIMRKIKMFMASYGIIAIYMRMLRVKELLKITGLPEDYILEGTQGDRKKFIGNAVPPALPKAIFEALYIELKKIKKAA